MNHPGYQFPLRGWLSFVLFVGCGGSEATSAGVADQGDAGGPGSASVANSPHVAKPSSDGVTAAGGAPGSRTSLLRGGASAQPGSIRTAFATGGTALSMPMLIGGSTALTITPTAAGGAAGVVAASGGSSSVGGTAASSTDCSAPPMPSPLVGWAAVSGNGTPTTTGGGNTSPIIVNTLSALQNAVKGTTPSVIYVRGTLEAGNINIGSNKTIVGTCGAEIHGHLELNGSVNVIVRNIKIVGYAVGNCTKDPAFDPAKGCSSGADAVTVQNSAHHIWFDHCDVSDGADGNLDITKAADYVTVSWTKFHYASRTDAVGSDSTGASGHRFSNLVGGSDSEASRTKLNVTWHHNWWADNVHERQPQVRFGKNHIFNNLWTSSGNNFCVRAVIDAHLLIEQNVFAGVKDPHVFYSGASTSSNIAADTTKNTYTNTSGNKSNGGNGDAFVPSYSYTLDALSDVQALVKSGAGPK